MADASVQPGPEAVYRSKLANGSFEVQRCEACKKHQFYPRVNCKFCGSGALNWIKPSGGAVVYSTTVVRRKPDDGGDYNVVIVELDEGPRMMSRVEGIPPQDVRIGQRVAASIKGTGNEAVLIFVVDEGARTDART